MNTHLESIVRQLAELTEAITMLVNEHQPQIEVLPRVTGPRPYGAVGPDHPHVYRVPPDGFRVKLGGFHGPKRATVEDADRDVELLQSYFRFLKRRGGAASDAAARRKSA